MAKKTVFLMLILSFLFCACGKEKPGDDLPALITGEEAREDAAGINEKNASDEAEKLLKEIEEEAE